MSESVEANLVQRIEEVIRDNERQAHVIEDLEDRVARLSLAVGHFSVLVQLAVMVRKWRVEGTDKAKDEMFAVVDQYDEARRAHPESPPSPS